MNRSSFKLIQATATVSFVGLLCIQSTPSLAEVFVADPNVSSGPSYYLSIVDRLQPGDTLQLPAGTYNDRLNLNNVQGANGAWIVILGPENGEPAIITTDSNCCNVVQLGNSHFVALKNVTIDSKSETVDTSIDAINAKGGITHDILIENCIIKGVSLHQQTVGISTKSTAWNWTVVGNTIVEAGTGIYFGSSDGSAPFVNGVIENNLFIDTLGYNMQVKHQNAYAAPADMPAGARRTIIRNNVFLKRRAQSSWPADKIDGPRPNLLVDGFPSSGPGADDLYEIYGNFFYQNADGESLIQASGRTSIHDNVFVDGSWTAILLTTHNLPLRQADIFNNTIYGGERGIRFASSAEQSSSAIGNLIFSDLPLSGNVDFQADNIVDSIENAALYVTSPSNQLGEMDFYPLPGMVQGTSLDLSRYSSHTEFDIDFNGVLKGNRQYRGAYAGEGSNPGWQLDAKIKLQGAETTRPAAPTNLTVE